MDRETLRLRRLMDADEKLSAAVYALATNPYNVKARLHAAWEPFVLADSKALPPRLRREYQAIYRALTRKPAGAFAKTVIGATLHRMHLKTAARIAARIVTLESELDYFIRDAER